MKSSAFKAAVAGAAALAAAVSLPAPAFAINKVTKGCARGSGFLYIENYGGKDKHCFANAGTLTGLAIYGVNYFESGNNRVTVWFHETVDSTRESSITLPKFRSIEAGRPLHKIVSIQIH